jgi:hypothetical protein
MGGMMWMTWALPVVITVVVLFFVLRMFGGFAKAAKERARLLQVGIPAQAQIVGVQQTGTFINNNPEVVIYLNVQGPSGPPYPVQVKQVVPIFQAAQFQVGAVIPVRIDPQNPANVAIAV